MRLLIATKLGQTPELIQGLGCRAFETRLGLGVVARFVFFFPSVSIARSMTISVAKMVQLLNNIVKQTEQVKPVNRLAKILVAGYNAVSM